MKNWWRTDEELMKRPLLTKWVVYNWHKPPGETYLSASCLPAVPCHRSHNRAYNNDIHEENENNIAAKTSPLFLWHQSVDKILREGTGRQHSWLLNITQHCIRIYRWNLGDCRKQSHEEMRQPDWKPPIVQSCQLSKVGDCAEWLEACGPPFPPLMPVSDRNPSLECCLQARPANG